jgi:putative transposase
MRATWQVSARRACSVLQAGRSSYHYKARRRSQAGLSQRIKEIAETRVRYGYRRIHVLLRREGWRVNAKRVWRLYREMGLQLRNKSPKRRVRAKLREGRAGATGPNEVWAMDFVHDQLFDGRKIRCLTSSIPSQGCRQRLTFGTAIAAPMSLRRLNERPGILACRR